jgi:threonine synthase
MLLYSTRNKQLRLSFREALFKGLSDDGGLYMPVDIPKLSSDFFEALHIMDLQEISLEIVDALLSDEIEAIALNNIIKDTLSFDIPLVHLHDKVYSLELFHGPTLAFKDVGARFMARCMSYFNQSEKKEIHILVATSGDTGSAVGNGFYKIPGIKVHILYPKGKVSKLQEMQLTTLGENINALEVDGSFDDCQALVKEAFKDKDITKNLTLSSGNSINIARLIPQSFYYHYAYAQLKENEPVVFSVPCGNFGNLCGGIIAKKMGLPVSNFIAATNVNDVFPSYLRTGKYEPKRSKSTISNAMDVGAPSNFERMSDLYDNSLNAFKSDISACSFTDQQTRNMIRGVEYKYNYMLDPHGAIAYMGLMNYMGDIGSSNAVFLETAHPAKFVDVIEKILERNIELPDELKKALSGKKQAITISENFEDLKAYLLNGSF